MRSAEKMRTITKHVERSSQEQSRGGKQITRSIESISEMVSQLNSAQREQARGGEQILAAVEQLREIARKQESRFGELARVVDQLSTTTATPVEPRQPRPCPNERAKWSKRNYYRFLDRFRGRFDLLIGGEPPRS